MYPLKRKRKTFMPCYRKHKDSPSYDVKIVIGDMNTQVGKEDIHCPTIGKHSLHENTNDNIIYICPT
jgi:hypothetical protein